MDDPPAPVLGDGEVRVLAGYEPGRVEEGNGGDGEDEDAEELPPTGVALGLLPRVGQWPDHQGEPEQQAHKEQRLPQAAKVDVLVALVAEPEVDVLA